MPGRPVARLSRRVGARVPLPRAGDAVAGTVGSWSAGVGQECEPFKGGGDLAGPRSVPGEAENPAPTGGDELAGCGKQAEPQATRFSESRLDRLINT